MAKYKNREVTVVQEVPHAQGDQVVIEHQELNGLRETVPMNQVTLTKEEKKAKDDERQKREKILNGTNPNDYRVEGETEQLSPILPTAKEVAFQRSAEASLERAEVQKKEDDAWKAKHPNAPANAKQQLDSLKVVPYKDETPAKVTK